MNISSLSTVVNSIKFIPEEVSEFDLGDFLYSEDIDILLHKSQLNHFLDILELHNAYEIEGDIVECGVWRGASAAILKSSVNAISPSKKMFLFDFFGEDVTLNLDKLTVKEKLLINRVDGKKIKLPNLESVKQQLEKFKLLDDSVYFVQGDVIETTRKSQLGKISLLHLDLDFSYTTAFVLNQLYDRVAKGGIIVINDYNMQSLDCKRAVDEFMNQHQIKNKLIEVGSHLAYWIKD